MGKQRCCRKQRKTNQRKKQTGGLWGFLGTNMIAKKKTKRQKPATRRARQKGGIVGWLSVDDFLK